MAAKTTATRTYWSNDPAHTYRFDDTIWHHNQRRGSGTVSYTNDQVSAVVFNFPVPAVGYNYWGLKQSERYMIAQICVDCYFVMFGIDHYSTYDPNAGNNSPPVMMFSQRFSEAKTHQVIVMNFNSTILGLSRFELLVLEDAVDTPNPQPTPTSRSAIAPLSSQSTQLGSQPVTTNIPSGSITTSESANQVSASSSAFNLSASTDADSSSLSTTAGPSSITGSAASRSSTNSNTRSNAATTSSGVYPGSGLDIPAFTPSVSDASPSGKSRVGPIIGGIIGGLLLALLILCLLTRWIKARRSSRYSDSSSERAPTEGYISPLSPVLVSLSIPPRKGNSISPHSSTENCQAVKPSQRALDSNQRETSENVLTRLRQNITSKFHRELSGELQHSELAETSQNAAEASREQVLELPAGTGLRDVDAGPLPTNFLLPPEYQPVWNTPASPR